MSPLTVFFRLDDDSTELFAAVIDGGFSVYPQLPVDAELVFSVWTGEIQTAVHTYVSVNQE